MKNKVKPVPDGYTTATPYLTVRGGAKAIDFYKQAFGAKELFCMPGPGGKIIRKQLVVQGKQNIRSKIIPTIVPAVHSRLEVVSRKLSQLAVTSSGRPQPCERRVDDTRKCEASHGAVGGRRRGRMD